MREEDIIDAIEGIDEELIAEAEKVRNGKGKRKGILIKSLSSVAAVFLITVISISAIGHVRSMNTTDGVTNSAGDKTDGWSDNEFDRNDEDGFSPITTTGENTVTVEITERKENGIIWAKVLGENINEKIHAGSQVAIKFDGKSTIEIKNTGEKKALDGIPGENILPVGSRVTIKYIGLIPPPPITNSGVDEEMPGDDIWTVIVQNIVIGSLT